MDVFENGIQHDISIIYITQIEYSYICYTIEWSICVFPWNSLNQQFWCVLHIWTTPCRVNTCELFWVQNNELILHVSSRFNSRIGRNNRLTIQGTHFPWGQNNLWAIWNTLSSFHGCTNQPFWKMERDQWQKGEMLWIGVVLGIASQLASGDFRASQWRASEWLG